MTPTGGIPPEDERLIDRQVTFALRSLPDELPAPVHVTERIAAALAAEAATREATAPSSGTVAWFRRSAPRALVAAAAVAVVGFGGYTVLTGSGQDTPTAGSAADSASEDRTDEMSTLAEERSSAEQGLEGEGGMSAETAPVPVPAETLSAQAADVWSANEELSPGCGQELATDLDRSLVGSAEVAPGVLVVVESADGAGLEGWVVGTCTELSDQAVQGPITVPVPTD